MPAEHARRAGEDLTNKVKELPEQFTNKVKEFPEQLSKLPENMAKVPGSVTGTLGECDGGVWCGRGCGQERVEGRGRG